MGIGASIFLMAAGAILTWGVTAEVEGANLGVIGTILMVVGGFGLLFSLLYWSDWGLWRPRRDHVDDVATDRGVVDTREPDGRRAGAQEAPRAERQAVTTRRHYR